MKITPIALALLAASSANAASPAKPTAQTIYLGGDIVTVNDAAPTAQALAIKDGRTWRWAASAISSRCVMAKPGWSTCRARP